MANRNHKPLRSGLCSNAGGPAAAEKATTAREQATCVSGEPEAGTLAEKRKRSQITLRNGAVVEVRKAYVLVDQLQTALQAHPEEFKSLLALAEGRPQDADPRHFQELKARAFLDKDYSIEPAVRDVLLICYEVTPEGPVVAPLRLKTATDLPAVERAQRKDDKFLRNILRRAKDSDDRSPD